MADEVGLIVNVRTRAAPGQLDRLRADVNGAVQQGAQKAFEKPAPIKGLLNDFRTKYDPAKGFTEKVPGAVPPTKKADPMSGIFGGGGGGAGGMLGPLAALTIVGQGIFGAITKVMDILATASPAFGASLKLIQKTLMMFLRPIGDLLASFLRPIARMMMQANREARREALKYGRPGSIEYTAVYTGALFYNLVKGIIEGIRELLSQLVDWIFGEGTFKKIMMLGESTEKFLLETLKPVIERIRDVLDDIHDLLSPFFSSGREDAQKRAQEGGYGAIGPFVFPVDYKERYPWLNGPEMYASGGYVPATPGGRIIGVAEGGEGEWIVPDSKVRGFAQAVGGGGTVNNLYFNGTVIGMADVKRQLKAMLDEAVRESRRR